MRKLRLISKVLTSQTGKQINTVHKLPKTSRSKDNQTMKFGKLIEYNIRNIFVERSSIKCVGETSLRSFLQKSKLGIS